MSLVVNNNLMASNVARNLNIHYGNLSTSTERLSSGLRINSAADDAAGLAIRELQRADIVTFYQGARNANDAISLIQTADGALQTIDEQLIRMKELAEQAATGTYDSTQRLMIESEYQQLASEITRISNATDFNGIKLLDGTLSGEYNGSNLKSVGELKVHFGTANDSAEDFYHINIGNTTASALGLGNDSLEASELATNPTNAGYEELRDESVQAIYDATYAERYEAHYTEIYSNLVSTADSAKPAIPLEDAAAQAAEQATVLATKEATADAEMAKATLDQIFDHTYASVYAADPRAQGPIQALADSAELAAAGSPAIGPTPEQIAEAAVAAQDALKIATDTVHSLTQKIAEDGNLTSLDAMLPLPEVTMTATSSGTIAGGGGAPETVTMTFAPEVTAFPVKTTSSAPAYIEQVGKEAYSAVYDQIYNGNPGDPAAVPVVPPTLGMYETAIADAKAQLGTSTLTTEQTVAIQNMVHEAAHAKATEWSANLQAGLQTVYDNMYNDGTNRVGAAVANGNYATRYDGYIAAGHPPDVAQIFAENSIATEAWAQMEVAVTDASADGAAIYYGVDTVTDSAKPLSDGALTMNISMDIPDSGNPPKRVTGYANYIENTAVPPTPTYVVNTAANAARNSVYSAINTAVDTYIDPAQNTRGLNGNQAGLVASAEIFSTGYLDLTPGGTISTQEAAGDALNAINEAIVSKDKIRAHLGAIQNRLEETINNLNIQAENLQASESRISDVDVAVEMTEFVRNQILTQSAVAMLSQANSLPQMAQQIISGG